MQGKFDQHLYQRCEDLQSDMLDIWRQLVNIDSGTGYGEGLSRVGTIAAEFLKQLGAEVKLIPSSNPDSGFQVVAKLTGQGTGKILAMAHMDTVFAVGTAAQRPFRIEGDWAYGPGVSDCKGSIVLCLHAIKLLQEANFRNYEKITCLFNCDEETGSPHSREIIKQLAQEHDHVLCLEPGQVGDGVVIWRKGSGVMKVEVQGRTSHAGSSPEDGRNALMELTHQVMQLSRLGNPEKQTTVNFTTIKAGDRTNVIPDYAVAQADVRVTCPEEFDRIEREAALLSARMSIPETQVKITLNRQNPPFPQNEGTDALIAVAQVIYGELGRTLKGNGAGGASDANWAASAGATVVDGLGPVKGGANHTENERTKLDSVVPRLYLLTRLFMEVGKNDKSDS